MQAAGAVGAGGGGGAVELLKLALRGLATLLVCGGGILLSSTVGSLAYPVGGVGAIFGAIFGFGFFLCLGCCVTGFWRDVIPESSPATGGLKSLLPHALAVQLDSHGDFTLVITIHKAENVSVQGRIWQAPDLFIEVECGNNPIKRTCVKRDGVFNEQFKLQITALDRSILLKAKDQNLFGSTSVGFVCIDIRRDILDGEFPYEKPFLLEASEGDNLRFGDSSNKAQLVLSFDHTADYPVNAVHSQKGEQYQKRRKDKKIEIDQKWGHKNYGSLPYLSQLEFNEGLRVREEEEGAVP